MSWFKRKPKEFDHAAIRVGNVYVLPPTEEDVRAFRRKRRRELTRRGFIAGGIAVALGALSIPFWPRAEHEPLEEGLSPAILTGFNPAAADPETLKQLRLACLTFYRHPDPEIRRLCADFMECYPRDPEVCARLWEMIRDDPVEKNRRRALRSLLWSERDQDVPPLVELYRSAAWARQAIDEALGAFGFLKLRQALK